jgi:hypothetical protein
MSSRPSHSRRHRRPFCGCIVNTTCPLVFRCNFQSTNSPATDASAPDCFLTFRENADQYIVQGLSSDMWFCREKVKFDQPLTAPEFQELRELLARIVFYVWNTLK